ncbi:MAG: hypothetical protein Q9212_004985 [Teloschistes hypoglaucus]
MAPELIYGTATFAMDMTEFQDPSSVRTVLETLHKAGIRRLDTAARYPPLKPGRAEELTGETNDTSGSFLVDTKVYTDTKSDGSGDLTPGAIEKSLLASLQRLQRPQASPPMSNTGSLESKRHVSDSRFQRPDKPGALSRGIYISPSTSSSAA